MINPNAVHVNDSIRDYRQPSAQACTGGSGEACPRCKSGNLRLRRRRDIPGKPLICARCDRLVRWIATSDTTRRYRRYRRRQELMRLSTDTLLLLSWEPGVRPAIRRMASKILSERGGQQ
jgi:hypothetical protein